MFFTLFECAFVVGGDSHAVVEIVAELTLVYDCTSLVILYPKSLSFAFPHDSLKQFDIFARINASVSIIMTSIIKTALSDHPKDLILTPSDLYLTLAASLQLAQFEDIGHSHNNSRSV